MTKTARPGICHDHIYLIGTPQGPKLTIYASPKESALRQTQAGSGSGELRTAVLKIPGVESANIVGAPTPTEIHIVSRGQRTPKQIVRDVQSLAAASFDLKIDHRIVSIVQLEGDPASSAASRPRIERVAIGNEGQSEWVEVTLRWPDNESTTGTGSSGRTREGRARGAITAVLECLDKALSAVSAAVEIDHILIQRVGGSDWVLVHAAYYQGTDSIALLGSAAIHDDVATAAARALLNAVNRKLPPL